MNIIVEKLDGRHKGIGHWTHRAQFVRDWNKDLVLGARDAVTKDFVETRTEFWNTFGPGCDREELYNIARATNNTPDWGWWVDPKGGAPYIYFKNGPMLSWFLMRS